MFWFACLILGILWHWINLTPVLSLTTEDYEVSVAARWPYLLFRRCLLQDDPPQNTECLATQLRMRTLESHCLLVIVWRLSLTFPFTEVLVLLLPLWVALAISKHFQEDAGKRNHVEKMGLGTREDKNKQKKTKQANKQNKPEWEMFSPEQNKGLFFTWLWGTGWEKKDPTSSVWAQRLQRGFWVQYQEIHGKALF